MYGPNRENSWRICRRSQPLRGAARKILFASSAALMILSAACQGVQPQSARKVSLLSTPEAAVTAFLHYLESGQYQSAVELLVDADGNPLDDSSRSAHVQAWLAAWGTQPDIHIAEIKFVDRAGLSTNELVKLHTSHGYKLTFNTLGKSAIRGRRRHCRTRRSLRGRFSLSCLDAAR